MKRTLALTLSLSLWPLAATAQVVPGHRLPEGPERPVRERTFHIQSYKAELAFDMARESIAGTATVRFEALRAPLSTLSLDAADIVVSKVERGGRPQKFSSDAEAFKLDVALDPPVGIGESATVAIAYTCKPRGGLYFFPQDGKRTAQAWNYGEGGLHRGWLPLYNDTNDRFAVEWLVTAPKPLTVVANGRLDSVRENADGTRTFHWIQEGPIPNYLVTVDVAELTKVPLRDAKVPLRGAERGVKTVPLSAWTPAGTEAAAKFVFGNTPDMVEYFSQKMGYPYPWDKYDQVVLREFSGARRDAATRRRVVRRNAAGGSARRGDAGDRGLRGVPFGGHLDRGRAGGVAAVFRAAGGRCRRRSESGSDAAYAASELRPRGKCRGDVAPARRRLLSRELNGLVPIFTVLPA